VALNATLDVSDVYHTLRNFQRSPEERLRRGLRHGRTSTRTVCLRRFSDSASDI
jgi:hypothetical protein